MKPRIDKKKKKGLMEEDPESRPVNRNQANVLV